MTQLRLFSLPWKDDGSNIVRNVKSSDNGDSISLSFEQSVLDEHLNITDWDKYSYTFKRSDLIKLGENVYSISLGGGVIANFANEGSGDCITSLEVYGLTNEEGFIAFR